MASSLFMEIRRIVDQAKAAGKPITTPIVWGLLKHQVPEASIRQFVSIMVGKRQLTRIDPPEKRLGVLSTLEPGPEPVTQGARIGRVSRLLGNMEHRRLMEARKAAREWLRS